MHIFLRAILSKSRILLVIGVAVLIIGALFVLTVYISFPQTTEWTVDYSFPGSDLDAQGEHYSVAGVYSTFYSSRDVVLIVDYTAPFNDHEWHADVCFMDSRLSNRTKEAQMQVIFTDDHNQVLDGHQLEPGGVGGLFATSYHGEIRIYLGSPLPLEELQEKECYGNWNVTFVLHHYPNLLDTSPYSIRGQFIRYFVLGVGLVAIVTGLVLTTLSLRKKT
jgi:hypothetical protein